MKLLVIGIEKRFKKFVTDESIYAENEICYAEFGASAEELLEVGKDADFILADALTPITAEVINGMPNLKMIHSEGVAFNKIDLEAARKRQIYVCNCKGMNSAAVAEHAIMLMLALLRDVRNADRSLRCGDQSKVQLAYMLEGRMKELGECTVGLIGFGDIAKVTAKRASAFGAKVLYYDVRRADPEVEEACGASYMELEEMVAVSDIVSIHVPVMESTIRMVNADLLAKMKKGAYFINTSRGELVDEPALLEAIRSGQLAGAGLDTITGEPIHTDHVMLQAEKEVEDKIIFTCHSAGGTEATFRNGYEMIWSDIRKVEAGEKPDRIVNPW